MADYPAYKSIVDVVVGIYTDVDQKLSFDKLVITYDSFFLLFFHDGGYCLFLSLNYFQDRIQYS